MSVEAHSVTQIQVENVVDYAQYIAQVQLGEALPDGTTVTFIDPSALDAAHVLDPTTMEIQGAIQIPTSVNIEHVILEQPIIDHLTSLQTGLTPPVATVQETVDIKPPVGKGPFNCTLCDKVFNKWNQLQRHLRAHDDDKPFRCMQCSASFNVEDNLKLHQATHVGEDREPICPECGKRFSRVASLKAHIMLHEKEENLMCPECGDEFSVQSQLDRHMNEHRQEHEGARTYTCRQCGLDFPKLAELREHMKQHYKIKASLSHRTYKRNIDRTGFSHRCKHCSKTFQKPSQLVRHERIHTGERPFKCSVCEKTFNQKGAMQVHMTKHTGERSHMCEFCPATFAQKGNLRAHINRVHTITSGSEQSTFQCEECSCVFKKLGSLNAHVSRAHSEPSELPTQVEMRRGGEDSKSGLGSNVIQQLLDFSEQVPGSGEGGDAPQDADVQEAVQAAQLHDQANSMAGASDILQQALENSGLTGGVPENGQEAALPPASSSAATAGRSGGTRSTMTMNVHDSATGITKRHLIRKVNGVRWHQCTYCSKEFKKPSDLVRHIRIHTHEKPYKCTQCFRAFAVKSTLTAHIKTHSGVKDYRCEVCNKLFSTQGSLKVHLRLHTGAKPFDCQHCDKKFRTSAHRKSHVQSHFRDPSDTSARPRRVFKRAARNDLLNNIPMQEPILITDTGLIQQPPRNSMFPQFIGDGSNLDRPYKCGHCQRAFKKSSHLKQHIRSHTGEKPFRCNMCMHSFVSSGVLKAHLRTHTGVKGYKCLICDTSFTTNGSLKRHMSTHSEVRPFMCPYCQKTFKTAVNCKKHMKTHRHELSMQSLQESNQPTGTDVVEEVGVVDNEEAVTTVPDTDLTQTQVGSDLVTLQAPDIGSSAAVQQHDLQNTALSDAFSGSALDQSLQQTLNQQVFGQQQAYGQSFTLTGQPAFGQLNNQIPQQLGDQLNAPLTSTAFTPNASLPQSTSALTAALNAPLSSMGTGHETQMATNSMGIAQNQFTFQPQQLDVGSLSSNFGQAGSMTITQTMPTAAMHRILPSGDQGDSEPEDSGPLMQQDVGDERRTFKCSECKKLFKKSSHLKQHMRSHTGEKPFKCNECHHSFVSAGVLKTHMKTHTGVREHRCNVCNATFITNGSLTRHMMIHTAKQLIKCPICDETFRTTVLCRRHIRSAHPKDPNTEAAVDDEEMVVSPQKNQAAIAVADEHQAAAANNTQLSISEKILMESAAEKDRISEVKDPQQIIAGLHLHQCPDCPKSFKKPSDLQRHIRIHTGEKPFACHLCQRTFTVKSTLDSHLRTHKPTEKSFACHVCGSMFSTKGSLKVHMRLHTGAKPFRCPICGQRFRTSGHRKSHILAHYKGDTQAKRGPRKRQPPAALLEQQQHQQQQLEQQQQQQQQTPSLIVFNSGEGAQQIGMMFSSGDGAQQVGLGGQTIDQSLLAAQNLLPVSLTVSDAMGQQVAGDGAQVLQNLVEGIQLHLTGTLPQGMQLAGLEAGPGGSILSQTVQIDASLLQQLQQQGNINITINPQLLAGQQVAAADPNLVQGLHLNQGSMPEAVNPNIIVQPMASMSAMGQATLDASQHGLTVSAASQEGHDPTVATAAYVTSSVAGDEQLVGDTQNVVLVEEDESVLHEVGEEVDEDNEEEDDEEEDGLETGEVMDPSGVSLTGEVSRLSGGVSGMGGMEAAAEEQGVGLMAPDQIGQLGAVNVTCGICFKGFERASQLKEHMREHQSSHMGRQTKRPKHTPHQCNVCHKSFQKPSQVLRHIRIHTGERPFICGICQKAFNQKNALAVHLKKHSGEKPHVCQYCNTAFTQRGNLKTHIKRAHHADMVQSMNIPKGYVLSTTDTTHGEVGAQEGVEMDTGDHGGVAEPTHDPSGVEGDFDLNDVADLL